ncbi:uncharacterized protein LOC144624723 [Crassostrea virginica]
MANDKYDLSVNKVAVQSTTATPPINDPSRYTAGNAVDRDITTCMRTKPIGPTSPDKTVWWKVDLGGVYNIYSVNILFKNYEGYDNMFQNSVNEAVLLGSLCMYKTMVTLMVHFCVTRTAMNYLF